jgi:hypothetical protein
MATRIIEYGSRGLNSDLPVVPANKKVAEQTPITATTTSAQSSAFNTGTTIVTIDSDEDVYVAFGANPTATTSSRKVYAKAPQDFAVDPGMKVAVRS